MKIVQVIPSLGAGGAERFVVDLCNELATKHDVTLCVFRTPTPKAFLKDYVDKHVRLVSLSKRGSVDFLFVLRYWWFLFSTRPNVVNTHLSIVAFYTYVPALLLWSTQFFHTIHNLALWEEQNRFLRFLRRLVLLTHRIGCISISEQTHRSLLPIYGHVNSRIVHNGIAMPITTPAAEEVQHDMTTLRNGSCKSVFLYVGRLHPQKQPQHLLSVFARLHNEGVGAHLLLVGDDLRSGQPVMSELRKNLPQNAAYLGPRANVPDYMSAVDALCLPSLIEGLPIVILEALALGLPIIATPVGGVPEAVVDGRNGFLAADTSADAFYQALKRFLACPPDAVERIRRQNMEDFQNKFTIAKAAKGYLAAYRG